MLPVAALFTFGVVSVFFTGGVVVMVVVVIMVKITVEVWARLTIQVSKAKGREREMSKFRRENVDLPWSYQLKEDDCK